MDIKIFKDHQALSAYAATQIIQCVNANPHATLGLATGGTPKNTYTHLINDYNQNDTDYAAVKTFNLDEYIGLAPTHPQSYHHYMKTTLFSFINLHPDNTYIPNGNAVDIMEEAKRYEQLIIDNPIDLQLLGIGTNGHIGFNEPGTPFDSTTDVIPLDAKTIRDNARYFETSSDVPKKAITMGIKTILRAKHIILLASGASKATAVKTMIKGRIDPQCPASILRTHPHVTILLDEQAAQYLKEETHD